MGKRISLRDFQASLVERLAEAKSGAAPRSLLGLQSGNDLWLLDLTDSGEIIPLGTLTAAPLTRPWFAGIANIRGALHAVTDFSAFQGGERTPTGSDARLVIPHARYATNSALLVSRVLGLRNPEDLTPEPAQGEDPRPWAGEAYSDSQGRFWRKLLLRPLLTAPDFLDIAA